MVGRFLSRQKANLLRPPNQDRRATPMVVVGAFFIVLGLAGLAFGIFYQSGLHLSLGFGFALIGAAERSSENRRRLTVGLRVASAVAFLGIPLFYVPMAYYSGFGQTGALVVAAICLVVIPLMWAEILGYFNGNRGGRRGVQREGERVP